MEPQGSRNQPDPGGPGIDGDIEILGALLDGTLTAREEESLHERLRANLALRRKLADLIIVRSLLAVGRASEERSPTSCAAARALFERYRRTETDQRETAVIARHLSECSECAASFEKGDVDADEPAIPTDAPTRQRFFVRAPAIAFAGLLAATLVIGGAVGHFVPRMTARGDAAANRSTGTAVPEASKAPLGKALATTSPPPESVSEAAVRDELAALLAAHPGFDPEGALTACVDISIQFGALTSPPPTPEFEVRTRPIASFMPEAEMLMWKLLGHIQRADVRSLICLRLFNHAIPPYTPHEPEQLFIAVQREIDLENTGIALILVDCLLRLGTPEAQLKVRATLAMDATTQSDQDSLGHALVKARAAFPNDAIIQARFAQFEATATPHSRLWFARALARANDVPRCIAIAMQHISEPLEYDRQWAFATIADFGSAADIAAVEALATGDASQRVRDAWNNSLQRRQASTGN